MAEVNGVKSPAVGSRPRNKKEVSFRPATLNVIARKHKPARSIGMNSTWVAILHHTIKDDAEADKEGAFQWVICMPRITIRTLLLNCYCKRNPVEGVFLKHEDYYPEELDSVATLRRRATWAPNVLALRAVVFNENEILPKIGYAKHSCAVVPIEIYDDDEHEEESNGLGLSVYSTTKDQEARSSRDNVVFASVAGSLLPPVSFQKRRIGAIDLTADKSTQLDPKPSSISQVDGPEQVTAIDNESDSSSINSSSLDNSQHVTDVDADPTGISAEGAAHAAVDLDVVAVQQNADHSPAQCGFESASSCSYAMLDPDYIVVHDFETSESGNDASDDTNMLSTQGFQANDHVIEHIEASPSPDFDSVVKNRAMCGTALLAGIEDLSRTHHNRILKTKLHHCGECLVHFELGTWTQFNVRHKLLCADCSRCLLASKGDMQAVHTLDDELVNAITESYFHHMDSADMASPQAGIHGESAFDKAYINQRMNQFGWQNIGGGNSAEHDQQNPTDDQGQQISGAVANQAHITVAHASKSQMPVDVDENTIDSTQNIERRNEANVVDWSVPSSATTSGPSEYNLSDEDLPAAEVHSAVDHSDDI